MLDYHWHTYLCGHAEGEPSEFVERGIRLGLREVGFAEHSPWMFQEDEKLAPSFEEMALYIELVQDLQAEYDHEIPIRLGIEMDYLREKENVARQFIDQYPFDLVLGSVHHIDHWGFDQDQYAGMFQERDLEEIYEQYFSLVEEMVATGMVDVVTHLDVVKKYGHRLEKGYDEIRQRVVATLRHADVVVEVNTSGLDRPCRELYPDAEFLKQFCQQGIGVTLGSDAHRPEEVGRHFEHALSLLRDLGFKEVLSFRERKRMGIRL